MSSGRNDQASRRRSATRQCIAAAVALLMHQASPASDSTEDANSMHSITLAPEDRVLNKTNLDRIKRHIIANGMRCTYSNMYNHNPCWALPPYRFYLNPDPGPDGNRQWNINCDITRGDFNTLVIDETGEPGRSGTVDFRSAGAITVRVHGSTFELPPHEASASRTMIAAAVAAALQAIDGLR